MRLASKMLSLAVAGLFLGGVSATQAATVVVNPAAATATIGTGNPTSPATLAINYSAAGTAGDAEADGFEIELAFSATDFTLATATAGTGFNCDINNVTGILLITYNTIGTQIPDQTLCTLTFTVDAAATAGAKPLTLQNAVILSGVTSVTPNLTNGTITLSAPVPNNGPVVAAGSPAFNSTTAIPSGGTTGGPAVTTNITFGASTGGSGTGTTALACSDNDAGTTLDADANQTVAVGATPAAITVSFTPGAARTVTVSCSATPQGGGAVQNFTYAFTVPAAAAAPPPPPAPEVIPASSLWSQLSLIALFSVLGGVFLALRRNA